MLLRSSLGFLTLAMSTALWQAPAMAQNSPQDEAVTGWSATLSEPPAPPDLKSQRRAALRTAVREQKTPAASQQGQGKRQLSPQERIELRRQLRQHKQDLRQ